jgi:hypothetical protein
LLLSSWYHRNCRWLTPPSKPIKCLCPIMWRGQNPLIKMGDAQVFCPVLLSPTGTFTFRRFQL